MLKRSGLSLVAVVMVVSSLVMAAEEVSLEGVTCLLQGKAAAKAEKHADYKEGKVYFCCDNCRGKFEKMNDEEKGKLAAKANGQLVATKQYVQKSCPFTGGKLNAEQTVKVAGAEVQFCCGNCKATAEKLEGDEQLEKVFGVEAFEKGKFAPVKAETK